MARFVIELLEMTHPPQARPLVKIQDAEYSFGKIKALDGLYLELRAGMTYGLLGNNGAGKTTAIHSILGLLRPRAGTISVFGEDPWKKRIQTLKRIGYFPEKTDPYDWMSLKQLFRLGEHTFPTWNRQRCQELCEQFALETHKNFGALSKGQAAKSKLVFAMAREPELLLLDEPTGGLDPGSRKELLDWIARATASRQMTTLFSSHHLGEVAAISTDIGILHDGKMVSQVAQQDLATRMAFLDFSETHFTPPPEVEAQKLHGKSQGGVSRWLIRDRHAASIVQSIERAPLGTAVLEPVDLTTLFHFVTTS